jgi:hypothetical protein
MKVVLTNFTIVESRAGNIYDTSFTLLVVTKYKRNILMLFILRAFSILLTF